METNASCPERFDAGRTMLGFGQEAWLYAGLARSKARWNLIAQDVLMAQLRRNQDGIDAFWTDDWNGYPANRARLLQHIHNRKISNPVVISGDIHSFFANDLKLDFDDQASPVVATEFVGSSISSYGPPYDPIAKVLPDNPHVHFFDSRRRGYVVVDLTADRDAGADARGFRRARSQGCNLYLQDIRSRGRSAGRYRGLGVRINRRR